jgi:hypothetical protein
VGTINKTKLENVLQRVDRSIEQDAGANLERGKNGIELKPKFNNE